MRRFFVESIANPPILDGDEHRHLAYVLRAKKGDRVILCTGDGYDNICEITAMDAKRTQLRLIERARNTSEPAVKLTAFVSVIKGDKMDLAVQKLTELGVYEIYPLITEFVQCPNNGVKTERLNRICFEAAKQCGRAYVPTVREPIKIAELPPVLINYDLIVFPYEGDTAVDIKTFMRASADRNIESVAMVIGCEGGFSESEVKLLSGGGATPVTMGPRILRAETANVTAASIIMYELGELK